MQVAGAYLTAEADTLAAVVARGNTAGGDIDMEANAVSGRRFGVNAGDEASGISWSTLGHYAGWKASGNYWGAYGRYAGESASGDFWGAYGGYAGYHSVHTNSHSFGRYAGRTARGNSRLYLDVYAADPEYAADGATNDTIFMDSDGRLYLGGGAARAENPSAGGVLRGSWEISGYFATDTTAITSNNMASATVAAFLAGGESDGGATNIMAGAADSYDAGTRTLTWNTNAVPVGTGGGGTPALVVQALGTLSAANSATVNLDPGAGNYITLGFTNNPITFTATANYTGTVWVAVTHAADNVGRTATWSTASFRLPGGVQPVLSQASNNVDLLRFTWGPGGKYDLEGIVRTLQ